MKVKKTFSRIKRIIERTPVHIIIIKIFRKLSNSLLDFFQIRYDLRKNNIISNKKFAKSLGFKIAKHDSSFLLERLEVKNILNSLISKEDIDFTVDRLSKKDRQEIISIAGNICSHQFDLLGSGLTEVSYNLKASGIEGVKYDFQKEPEEIKAIKEKILLRLRSLDIEIKQDFKYEPINWHIDFKSGYVWDENIWYKKVKTGHLPGVDIKVPWELSRFHHLAALGQAYAISGDEKYALEYMFQVIDWIENNKPQFGVNWKCTMDVAIRAANIIMGLIFFKDTKIMSEKFLIYLLKNIYLHGSHIVNNLEFSSITSNHYLSDISGLVFISELFQETPVGIKWKRFTIKELKREMDKQVHEDGTNFEASTCYHRLVLELFFYSTLSIIKTSKNFNGVDYIETGREIFEKSYINKLFKMFEYILYISKINKRIPQLGDNDNGRFFIFGRRNMLDIGYMLSYAAIFFNNDAFKIKEFDIYHDALWIFGRCGYLKWKDLKFSSISNISSRSFDDSGIYVMRKNSNYLIATCGPNGQNDNGGHAHNDKLSFELSVNGEDIIVDPGTYIYTPFPEIRNDFRATSFHNTVSVDGKEQNRFIDSNIFSLENDSKVKVNKWISNKKYDFLDAQHHGYIRLKNNIVHRRKIYFSKSNFFLVIKDIFEGQGENIFDSYFVLSDAIDCSINKGSFSIDIISRNSGLQVIPLDSNFDSISMERSWISHGYGNKINSNRVKYSLRSKMPAEFILVLQEKNHIYQLSDIRKIIKENIVGF